jgi:hypothetical protein
MSFCLETNKDLASNLPKIKFSFNTSAGVDPDSYSEMESGEFDSIFGEPVEEDIIIDKEYSLPSSGRFAPGPSFPFSLQSHEL